jgi:ribonuclease D
MEILVARSSAEIDAAFERLSKAVDLGCDTETGGLRAKRGRLLSVQFSDGNFSVLVPASEGVPLGKLAQILENPNIVKIFHNARFDLEFLRENGYETINVFDTMIAERILTRGADQSSSLAETLYRYFAVNLNKSLRAKFTDKNWNGVWTDELVNYALSDTVYLPKLKQRQIEWLKRLNLTDKYLQNLTKLNIS